MTIPKPRPSIVLGESHSYPVLPLRDIVVFPHMIVPLFVGREKSIRALEEVMKNDALIMLATQKNASDDDPSPDSIYETGTLASVLQLLKLTDGTVKVLVEGLERARVQKYTDRSDYYEATAVALADTDANSVEAEALARSVVSDFESYVKLNKKISAEVVGVVQAKTDFAELSDAVAAHLAVKIADRQAILETLSVTARLEKVLGLMESEISVLQVEKRIRSRVKRQMEKTQREYYLNEQMKAIQKELGDDEGRDELADLEEKIAKTKLSKEAREKAQHELKKLRQMSPMSAEATVVRNYLDWLLSIPWNKKSKVKKDLEAAQAVLDAEQNATFNDHYLEVDYDLSNVMFITTANTLNIPGPLMDRMEIIRIAGYTENEKVEIARKHLIPNAISKHGLDSKEWSIDDEALLLMIRRYTREAGVRNLERELSTLARKAVKELMISKKKSVKVTAQSLEDFLGVPKYRYGEIETDDQIGIVTGLAWTDVGGELLTIEGVMMPGKGKMTVTGNLRDVMKESISAAASYVRSRAITYGIEPPLFDRRDIHVHVPEGATPKDGPSAGVAMATAIISVMTGIPVRHDVAMTGEITLRGRVLPIGGLKEKLLAAARGGIKTVLIPEDNAKDLTEISDAIKGGMEIIPVARLDDVVSRALVRAPVPIVWEEDTKVPVKPEAGDEAAGGLTAH